MLFLKEGLYGIVWCTQSLKLEGNLNNFFLVFVILLLKVVLKGANNHCRLSMKKEIMKLDHFSKAPICGSVGSSCWGWDLSSWFYSTPLALIEKWTAPSEYNPSLSRYCWSVQTKPLSHQKLWQIIFQQKRTTGSDFQCLRLYEKQQIWSNQVFRQLWTILKLDPKCNQKMGLRIQTKIIPCLSIWQYWLQAYFPLSGVNNSRWMHTYLFLC